MFDASQSDTHDSACSCSACASQALLKTDDSGEVSENYVIYGGKWGDSGTMDIRRKPPARVA